jgi:hypothetical protein
VSAVEPTAARLVISLVLAEHASRIGFDGRSGMVHQVECLNCEKHLESVAEFRSHVAEAVVAAIRAMSPQQQAELIGGEARTCLIDVTDHAGQPRRLRERNIVVLGWVDEVRDV